MSDQEQGTRDMPGSCPADPLGFWLWPDAPLRAIRSELLRISETGLRKQADLLAEFADARQPSDLLLIQARHVHELWADMLRDVMRAQRG